LLQVFANEHSPQGADMALMIREYIETKGILPRGLAHPIIFSERGPAWQSLTVILLQTMNDRNSYAVGDVRQVVILFRSETIHFKGTICY
jgi:hypothetical protein